MKILIGVKSCQQDMHDGCHQAIRDTWASNLPEGVEVKFFIGGVPLTGLLSDEIQLPVNDDYWYLTPKTRGISQYTVDNDYDFTYFCDTDTYLIVSGLLETGFQHLDFSGGHLCTSERGQQFGIAYSGIKTDRGYLDKFYVYLSGGVGFFVSNQAADILATSPFDFHSEDMWAGQVLGPYISQGTLKAELLDNVEECSAWHLNCGWYGGGNNKRLSPADAIRKKHQELFG